MKVSLNLGSGVHIKKGFINVDNYFTEEEIKTKKGRFANAIVEKGGTFIKADIKNLPFKDNYADYVELMNTIEHFPMHHILEYMKEIYRVMKPKAKLLILTNSFSGIAVDWLRMVTDMNLNLAEYNDIAEVIYGNQYGDSEGEVHRCPFTPQFMNYVLGEAGFKTGTIVVIPKGAVLPKFGTVAAPKGSVARNSLLFVETQK